MGGVWGWTPGYRLHNIYVLIDRCTCLPSWDCLRLEVLGLLAVSFTPVTDFVDRLPSSPTIEALCLLSHFERLPSFFGVLPVF